MKKLNVGCGPVQPRGWVNIDGSNRAWIASRLWWLDRAMTAIGFFPPTEFGPHVFFADIAKRWPFAADSCSAVYAGEVWEHFVRDDAEHMTKEAFRVLAPGGVLRIRVPDGAAMWRNYLRAYDIASGKEPGCRPAEVAEVRRHAQMYFENICVKRPWFGSMGHFHKWHWDEVQLVELLRDCGFVEVTKRAYHDSRIPDVSAVENRDDLQIEGIKP